MTPAAAHELLTAWASTLLTEAMERAGTKGASPRMMARAAREAEGKLNRAARRALGARSDYRFHPLAAHRAIPARLPALRTRNSR
jgi:hypothetical protein